MTSQEPNRPDPITYTVRGTGNPAVDGRTFTHGYPVQDPVHGLLVDFGQQKIGSKKVSFKIRTADKPDLLALANEYLAADVAVAAYWTARRQEEADRDAALVADMNRQAAEFVALIPADHVRVTVKRVSDGDGDYYYEYAADGTDLPWNTPGMVHHGTAFAKRPGAMNAFAVVDVRSISRADLEAVRDGHRAKADAANAKAEAVTRARAEKFAEAARTGSPVELRRWTEDCCERDFDCSTDVVTEYALPDGGTKRERVHTH